MATLLLQPPEYWDYRHATLNSADRVVASLYMVFIFYFFFLLTLLLVDFKKKKPSLEATRGQSTLVTPIQEACMEKSQEEP